MGEKALGHEIQQKQNYVPGEWPLSEFHPFSTEDEGSS
jgi:hypothetical protein